MEPETRKEPKQLSRKALRAKLAELNEEYRFLAPEAIAGSGAASQRRFEIAQELRNVSTQLFNRESDVEVTVPRSATGHPFRIGERKFPPGIHKVKASVAQYLMWLIGVNRTNEVNRLRQNGEQVDLGAIGDKARQLDEREL